MLISVKRDVFFLHGAITNAFFLHGAKTDVLFLHGAKGDVFFFAGCNVILIKTYTLFGRLEYIGCSLHQTNGT